VDVLITDVVMPGMDGSTLAKRARAQWPRLPVVFLSGFHQLGPEALVDGAVVLSKPVRAAELLGAVAKLVPGAASTAA
jgi:two-component system cell cycle sensor histidine kinase/response regulator CckA